MPVHPLRLGRVRTELADTLRQLPEELGLSREFPAEVLAETASALARGAALPDRDARDLELVTLDPAGTTDLDQAFAIERSGSGWSLRYAIADLSAWVEPGGAIDAEARRRGQTIYAADGRIPLHPAALSEDAASLLPDRERSAYLWELDFDGDGQLRAASVGRARVRSRRALGYDQAQADLDAGRGPDLERLRLLGELGTARLALETTRGGASLSTPETLVEPDGRGGYRLERRHLVPVERWNAQLSLATGMAAAEMMLAGGIGILRTMPPAEPEAFARFRRQARALGEPWPNEEAYGAYLRRLDGEDPAHLAILHAAAGLFRGATYAPFDGAPPEHPEQAAIGAPYAHVTAPLRRLVDRFGLAVCAALSAGEEVPGWARAALPELPRPMARSSQRAGDLDRRTLDHVEAAVLAPHVGEDFEAVVLASSESGSRLQLRSPAVTAPCAAPLDPGTDVRVRLISADVAAGSVEFRPL